MMLGSAALAASMATITASYRELEVSIRFHQTPGTMGASDHSPICSPCGPKYVAPTEFLGKEAAI
jgi:hypothetical protein